MNDLIDERGHTREQAQMQHPNLDLDAPPASEETPEGSNTLVPAQSAEEVQAQFDNRAGAPDDSHDLTEQLVAAGRYEADEDDETAMNDEARAIAEATEELAPNDEDDDEDE